MNNFLVNNILSTGNLLTKVKNLLFFTNLKLKRKKNLLILIKEYINL